MRKVVLVFSLVLILVSCKKNHDEPIIPPTYSVDTTIVYPSSAVIITSNKQLTIDTATIIVGGKPTLLAKLDSFKYVFILPVIPSGKYKLDLSKVQGVNNPDLTVGNYATITNPNTVLNNFSVQFKTALDTLLNTKYKSIITSEDSLFLRQSLAQFNKNLLSLTDAQKNQVAYLINQLDFSPVNARGGNLDTNYMAFSSPNRPVNGNINMQTFGLKPIYTTFDHSDISYGQFDFEIGEQMFNKAKETSKKVAFAVASGEAVIPFGVLAYIQPETTPLFIAAIINYRYRMQIAVESVGETLNMISIAENVGTNNPANPITLNKAQIILQKIISKFRSANLSDANNQYFGNVIKNDNDLVVIDIQAKSKFDKIKDFLSYLFDLFTQKYNAYISQVKNTLTEKLQQVNNKFVTITNISNPDIVITATDGGINGLQIVATNPANNITANTPISYKINYTQVAINNVVSVTQQATYVPQPPIELTTTAITSVTSTTAVTGGNITSDGGATITVRGICWATKTGPTINNFTANYGTGVGSFTGNCTNLTANTNYFVRVYATNANGTFYGNEISFTTPSAVSRSGINVAGGNGAGSTANQLYNPSDVFVDNNGNIYINDFGNDRIQKWAPGATAGVTVAGGNGQGSAANQLYRPASVFVDGSGNIYVADLPNDRIQKWAPGATAGVTVAGGNGQGSAANQLFYPNSVFVDASGNIYILDPINLRIQKWAPGATSGVTVAGGNGQGSAANQLNNPFDIFVDGSGNIYIADVGNYRIQKWAPGAIAGVTVAGGNGAGAAANQISGPRSIFIDFNGNIYISDIYRVQKWVPGATSGITVAGDNGPGASDNQFTAYGIFVDGSGNIYIADSPNNRIQKWPPM
jgi:sugar lactone lactonase YvrE